MVEERRSSRWVVPTLRESDESIMTCGYCQLSNPEEEHRCGRCGRRLTGTAVAAPPAQARGHVRLAVRAMGANALAAHPLTSRSSSGGAAAARAPEKTRAKEISLDAAATLDGLPQPRVKFLPPQPSLFGAELQSKLIPFESLPRIAAQPSETAPGIATTVVRPISTPTETKHAARPATRRVAPAEDPQATLDFLPPLKTTGRTLKTDAEAVIFCDAAVAGPLHRATAAALDLSIITIAFVGVLITFQFLGKPVAIDRITLVMLGGMFGMAALFYGLLFAITGTVTPGMRWAHLRLITFDGFPLDGRNRALRLAGTWISVLSGGIGLLWALLDEENLTWHDHISKSFPALRESQSNVVRQPRL